MPDSSPGDRPPSGPDELAVTVAEARRKYLDGQQLPVDARKADEWLQQHGDELPPQSSARRESLERQLDDTAGRTRQAEAVLAARATADGGEPLTPTEAERFLLAIGASGANLALFRAAPQQMTALLNRVLTRLDGPFETKLELIVTHMR